MLMLTVWVNSVVLTVGDGEAEGEVGKGTGGVGAAGLGSWGAWVGTDAGVGTGADGEFERGSFGSVSVGVGA